MVTINKELVEQETKNLVERVNLLMGDQYILKSCFSNNLCWSVSFRFVDKNPTNGIDHNSPVFFSLFLFLSDENNSRELQNLPEIAIESNTNYMHRLGVKFRKTKSKKSVSDLYNKVYKWFEKNQQEINKILENN